MGLGFDKLGGHSLLVKQVISRLEGSAPGSDSRFKEIEDVRDE